MSSTKLITVFGATGKQGGAVVRTFLNDPKLKGHWRVRGITRDHTKDSAKKLSAQGVECVSADLSDEKSLAKAVEGSDVVFGVTNYWETLDDKLEVRQGKNIVDAAKEAKVGLLIWSTLKNVKEMTNGRLPHVYHFDSKAAVAEYARQSGVPSAFFMPGVYISGFTPQGGQLQYRDGSWVMALPVPGSSPAPVYATEDTGKYVKAIVLNKEHWLGKNFLGATKYYTFDEMVEGFKKVFPEAGKTAKFQQVPPEMFQGFLQQAGLPEFAAEELKENFMLFGDVGYFGGESLDESHKYVEDHLTTWEEWLKNEPQFKDLK